MQMPSNRIQRVHQSFRPQSVKRSFRQDISLTPNYKSQTGQDFCNSVLFLQNVTVGLLNNTIVLLCEISASEKKHDRNTRRHASWNQSHVRERFV